jgi:hypothetical protein
MSHGLLHLLLQLGFKACAAGGKEQEAHNFLEKKFKANSNFSTKETIEVNGSDVTVRPHVFSFGFACADGHHCAAEHRWLRLEAQRP